MRGAKGGWRQATGLLVAWLLLQAAIDASLGGVPVGLADIARPQSAAPPPWLPGGLSPLTERFIAFAGGVAPVGTGATATAAGRGGPAGANPGQSIAATPERPSRTVVELRGGHDTARDAYPISTLPFTSRSTTPPSSSENPANDCVRAGPSLWFSYRPTTTRGVLASTTGSRGGTALGAFSLGPDGTLVTEGCDLDSAGAAQVPLRTEAGTTYLFQVGQPVGGRSITFNLDPLGTTTRVSVDGEGREHDAMSLNPALSADGRVVAFATANALLPEDTNDATDVYLRDLFTGQLEYVPLVDGNPPPITQPGATDTYSPTLSGDGRFVGFFTKAPLVPDDTNDNEDLYIRDRRTGRLIRGTVSSDGTQGTLWFHGHDPTTSSGEVVLLPSAAFSHDGRHVAFTSELRGLAEGDAPCSSPVQTGHPELVPPSPSLPADLPKYVCRHIFVRDLSTGVTRRVSIASDGTPADHDSGSVHMSPDGRFVVFGSHATNLSADDTNGLLDVYRHDRDTDGDGIFDEPGAVRTDLVSVSLDGSAANGNSGGNREPGQNTISADGRFVAFLSAATNLVANDLNAAADVFVRDMAVGTTSLVSALAGTVEAGDHTPMNGASHQAFISADGRRVAFSSEATNLVAEDRNFVRDAFVVDLPSGAVFRVSVSSDGNEADGSSFEPVLSADGWAVAFVSLAGNLTDGDQNSCAPTGPNEAAQRRRPDECLDVFVHRLGLP